MGRHSSPDDDEDDLVDALLAVGAGAATDENSPDLSGASPDPVGRHAQPATRDRPAPTPQPVRAASDVAGNSQDEAVPVIEAPGTAAPPAVAPPEIAAQKAAGAAGSGIATNPVRLGQDAPAPAPTAARTHSTAADLALVRHHGDVRARCLAGLLVPFIVYVAALAVVGASSTAWALWVFAPLVVAGVLVGTFLDAGHKRYPDG